MGLANNMTEHNGSMTPSRRIERLVEIMAALRTPGTGCPWDLEQTFDSIVPYTLEEAYEVADAIARNDLLDLKEELGDLLLQVVYYAQLAAEETAFDFGDVVQGITAKMIRRHPHVFAGQTPSSPEHAKAIWARIKAEEKAAKAAERVQGGPGVPPGLEGARRPSVLDNVPPVLPALTRAVKLQDKAASVGFDWPTLAPVFDKMREELLELEEVALGADPRGAGKPVPPASADRIEDEFGDLLFVMANVARHLNLDPEAALRRANAKFQRRFTGIEARLAAQGKLPSDSNLAEMDALWDAVKLAEKTSGT
jgi:nucleoside triphosphate diphosphatase